MSKKAVLLLSGGLDSTTALCWAMKKGYQCETLSFNYGQLHQAELIQAQAIADSYGLTHSCLNIDLSYLKTPLLSREIALPEEASANQLSQTQAPSPFTVVGRNTLFFAHAMSYAAYRGIGSIILGFNSDDHAFCDCSPHFVEALRHLTRYAIDQGPLEILTPLITLNKVQILELALELDAPIKATLSCYRPIELSAVEVSSLQKEPFTRLKPHYAYRPCGACHACSLRNNAFAKLGLCDPALS